MKAKPDCIACMFKQALNTARIATSDTDIHLETLRRTAEWVAGLDMTNTPAALSQPVYEIVTELTGNTDPYAEHKKRTNTIALATLEHIRKLVNDSTDPMDAAAHAAVAGNVIDLGIGHDFNIEDDIRDMMGQSFAINDIEQFRSELVPGKTLLYLSDNAGEIVFDRLLVEKILETGAKLTFVVKSGPIINDATMADARTAGITELARVIETGAADIGINWNNVSNDFMNAVSSADVVVAKGHGNFETCNDRPENFYFLLKAKCAMVASELGCCLNDIVFKHSP